MEITPSDRKAREAEAAEREASRRIEQASKRVEEANHEASVRIDSIKDEYVRARETENLRGEASLEAQRGQGYERLRDVKRAQEAELRKVRDEGSRETELLDRHYRETSYATRRHGEDELKQLQSRHAREIENEGRQGRFEEDAAKTDHSRAVSELQEAQRQDFEATAERSRQDRESLHRNHDVAVEQARERFQQNFQRTVAEQQGSLSRLNADASRQLEGMREDYSQRLSEFADKQHDPFYRLLDIDGEIHETGDAFILRARVPEHEQRNVNVTIKGGNQVVVSGFRRSEQKQEDEPGHLRQSQAYQSFSESFPLSWPVDARGMTREIKGDEIVVRLPKKVVYEPPGARKPREVARARADRPDFPKDIPSAAERSSSEAKPTPKSPGSGTLS